MTDTYGMDPHNRENGHDEILTHEQDVVREAPSDYEFADEHGASAAEEQAEDTTSAVDVKPAGRSPLVPIAAAIGGVVLLGAAAWWQFGGGSNAMQTPANNAPPAMTATLSVAPKTADIPTPVSVPTAPMAAPTSDVASTIPTSAPTPVLSAPPAVMPGSSPMVAMAPIPPTPSMPGVASSAMPMMATTQANENTDQRIEALTAHVDMLQKSLDQANQQLSQVTNMVAAGSMNAGTPSTKDLQDKLDKVEGELAALRLSAPELAVPPSASGDVIAVTPLVAKKSVSHHQASHKVTLAAKSMKKATVASVPKPAPVWVLRAATPGQAWVASSSTTHDLKQLQVGDTLEGIGKVTAIQLQNGNWVVQGTKGQIQ